MQAEAPEPFWLWTSVWEPDSPSSSPGAPGDTEPGSASYAPRGGAGVLRSSAPTAQAHSAIGATPVEEDSTAWQDGFIALFDSESEEELPEFVCTCCACLELLHNHYDCKSS